MRVFRRCECRTGHKRMRERVRAHLEKLAIDLEPDASNSIQVDVRASLAEQVDAESVHAISAGLGVYSFVLKRVAQLERLSIHRRTQCIQKIKRRESIAPGKPLTFSRSYSQLPPSYF